MAVVEFLMEQEFSLLRIIQTGSEAHSASYPMGTGGLSGWDVKLTAYFHLVPWSKMVEL
jgi:hypothetical protein